MVWIAQLLGLNAAQQAAAGIAAIIGHNWPVFLRFQGGRGIFTSLGVIAMLEPWLGLIALVFTYLFAPLRQVSLGVGLALIILPITSWFASQPLGVEEPLAITLAFIAILLIVLVRRLSAPRRPISASVPPRELIINRILYDRDIRDRKAWISQTRSQVSPIEQPDEEKEKPGQ